MTTLTTAPTESDLEARIDAALRRIFPWIEDIRHQTRFEVKFGRNKFEMDGAPVSAEGRSDIVLYRGDQPLAVLELKREGLRLTDNDVEQGRSYARLVGAPLVIVTNGVECKIFATHNLSLLSEGSIEEAQLAAALAAGARASTAAVGEAVSTLLGSGGETWRQAIRAICAAELAELTSDWDDPERKFVDGFLVPRKATRDLLVALRRENTKRAVIVEGPPLVGKSSVLRELTLKAASALPFEVLFLDGASCSEGAFQRLANLLAMELAWPATANDARNWLRGLSQRSGHGLIIAIDGPAFAHQALRSDVDELVSRGFGRNLRVVIALDENSVPRWTKNESGRDSTKLGRFSETVTVDRLDEEEFSVAEKVLHRLGGKFVFGADKSPEFRSPWVLRAVAARALDDRPPEKLVALPPLLGLELVDHVHERFPDLDENRSALRRLAGLYVDSVGRKRSAAAVFLSMHVFTIDEAQARKRLDRDELRSLYGSGIARRAEDADGKPSMVIRLPELFAAEVASVLASQLINAVERGVAEATAWFTGVCSLMPLGDLVGARAILEAASKRGDRISLALLNEMLRLPPYRESLPAGFRGMVHLPDVGVFNLDVTPSGKVVVSPEGVVAPPLVIAPEEVGQTIGRLDPWLILSQLSGCAIMVIDDEREIIGDAMPSLLLELAACPVVLRKPSPNFDHLHIHEIEGQGEIACSQNGIVEAVTMSIVRLLSTRYSGGDFDRDEWIREAVSRESLPLMNRLSMALFHLTNLEGTSDWASKMLTEVVRPAMARLPLLH